MIYEAGGNINNYMVYDRIPIRSDFTWEEQKQLIDDLCQRRNDSGFSVR